LERPEVGKAGQTGRKERIKVTLSVKKNVDAVFMG